MNIKNLKWFTFVELIVVITLISILTTIWTFSYVWYLWESRDSQRKSDLTKLSSALKMYKQKRWYYAIPWKIFNISYSWTILAKQWKLDTNVRLNSLENLPIDPKNKLNYIYSITANKQEYEIWATLENDNSNMSYVEWNYKSVSKNVLPTLLIATWAVEWANVEIKEWNSWADVNRKLFVYNSQYHNLAYTFKNPYNVFSDWISFTGLLNEVETNSTYWQNSDYRNCTEIKEAWKLLLPLTSTPFEYQIITETGALVNTWCTL